MIISTTPTIEGKEIKEYLGIVSSDAIIGVNLFKDIFASVRDLVGGRSATYEKELSKAKQLALEEMEKQAAEKGANAVAGVDLDFETVGSQGSMLMVSVSGTAVKI